MSDVESTEEISQVEEEEGEEIKDVITASKKVLKNSAKHGGLVCGLHQVAKKAENGKALICFLAESCSEPTYKKLVHGLCKERNIPLINLPDSKQLGEWAGLCKIDKEGQARKVVGASCVAIHDYGEESDAVVFLQNYTKTLKA